MLSTLSILNFADIDSEEEMLSYGIGIILMNVGMYFAVPAIVIYKIRK
jgi:peptidyl-prolyl cis-trans isomerase B (cyclophilin B)